MVYVVYAIHVIYVIFWSILVFFVIYGRIGAYEIYHMTVIYMLIWVLIEASGSQEFSPAFETPSKNYAQRKKEENLAT